MSWSLSSETSATWFLMNFLSSPSPRLPCCNIPVFFPDQDSIRATSPFPNLLSGSSLQHRASPSWEQCPCSAVVCVLLSCYYKEKELCMELIALSSSTGSRRTSVCHLAADFSLKGTTEQQASYPNYDLRLSNKVLFSSRAAHGGQWAGRGFPKHKHHWDFSCGWVTAWWPQTSP